VYPALYEKYGSGGGWLRAHLRDVIYPWSKEREDLEQRSLLAFVKATPLESPLGKRLGWFLPGHGSSYADCGSIKAKGCLNVEAHPEGKVFGRYYKKSCRRKACRICMEDWATAEAEKTVIRFAAFLYGYADVKDCLSRFKSKFKGKPRRDFHRNLVNHLEMMIRQARIHPIHLVVSPPQDRKWDAVTYRKDRTRAYSLARKCGFRGGNLTVHPYRWHCRQCHSAIPDYSKACPRCGYSDFHWQYSPHFHAVGYGFIHGTKENYEETGWLVKNIGVRKSVFWTMQYLLSHAGVFDDPMGEVKFHVTTWFGNMAYNMLKVPKIGTFLEVCPICMRPLVPLIFIGGEDRPPPIYEKDAPNEFLADLVDWGRFS
jgi:hypothetical protein